MSGIRISKIICSEVDREQELSENSERVDVSHCEENKVAERKALWFITAWSTHHAGSQGSNIL